MANDHGHKERVKDQHTDHEHASHGLSTDLEGFWGEVKKKFPSARMTSGRRKAKEGDRFSHHHHGDAIDFGAENSDVFNYLNNTQEGLNLMAKYKLGILDETNPETLKKTGGTGFHFHVGKDKGLYARTQNRLKAGDNLVINNSYISRNPAKPGTAPANTNLNQGSRSSNDIQGSVGTIEIVMPNNAVGQAFMEDVENMKEINKKSDEKEKKSNARQKLKRAAEEKFARQKAILDALEADPTRRKRPQGQGQELPASRVDFNVQRNLPDLPSLFDMGVS